VWSRRRIWKKEMKIVIEMDTDEDKEILELILRLVTLLEKKLK
jgi:hypothetical protein